MKLVRPTASELHQEGKSAPKYHGGRKIVLLSVTLAILTITAHTAAIIQVLSMTKELAETRHEAAEGKLSDLKLGIKLEKLSLDIQDARVSVNDMLVNIKSINRTLKYNVEHVIDRPTRYVFSNHYGPYLDLDIEVANTSRRSVENGETLRIWRYLFFFKYHQCMPPYFLNIHKCIRIVPVPANWTSAKAYCEEAGESLAGFRRSDHIDQSLLSQVQKFTYNPQYWIYLTDINGRKRQDGTDEFSCGYLSLRINNINDIFEDPCSKSKIFICEKI